MSQRSAADIAVWPFWGLSVQSENLELRMGTEDEILATGRLAARYGIHDPSFLPFSKPWSRLASPLLERSILMNQLRVRGAMTANAWRLDLTVFFKGEPIGFQGLMAENFGLLRTFASGSWLAQNHQGKGLGKEMRRAILALGFAGLSGQRAETEAVTANTQSTAISRRVGYVEDGVYRDLSEGKPVDVQRFVMTKDQWETRVKPELDVTLLGVEACLPMLIEGAPEAE